MTTNIGPLETKTNFTAFCPKAWKSVRFISDNPDLATDLATGDIKSILSAVPDTSKSPCFSCDKRYPIANIKPTQNGQGYVSKCEGI